MKNRERARLLNRGAAVNGTDGKSIRLKGGKLVGSNTMNRPSVWPDPKAAVVQVRTLVHSV